MGSPCTRTGSRGHLRNKPVTFYKNVIVSCLKALLTSLDTLQAATKPLGFSSAEEQERPEMQTISALILASLVAVQPPILHPDFEDAMHAEYVSPEIDARALDSFVTNASQRYGGQESRR